MKKMQEAEALKNYAESMEQQFAFNQQNHLNQPNHPKKPNFMPKFKNQNEFAPNYSGLLESDFYVPNNFEKKRVHETYEKKNKTQPFSCMEDQRSMQQILTENFLIGDENEEDLDSPDKYDDLVNNLGYKLDDSNGSKSNESHSLKQKIQSFEKNSQNVKASIVLPHKNSYQSNGNPKAMMEFKSNRLLENSIKKNQLGQKNQLFDRNSGNNSEN